MARAEIEFYFITNAVKEFIDKLEIDSMNGLGA